MEPQAAPEIAPVPPRPRERAPLRLTALVLMGSLLTFVLEPLVGRLLLPTCGGGSHVWTTCLMFFQGALCLGYLQCHLLAPRLGRWQLAVYLLPLPFLPLAALGIEPDPAAPVASIWWGLLRHVAVPFAALSTTAVVAQQWLARAGNAEPYRLYAASNWGSFLGLFLYPLLIEPLLPLRTQRLGWSVAYLGFLLLIMASFPWRAGPAAAPRSEEPAAGPPPGPARTLSWFLLALWPSAFLLAVTNTIAMDLGSAPFVWVLPLGLYLLSFVFAFGRGGAPWVVRRFWPEVSLLGLDFFCIQHGGVTLATAGVHLCALLCVCWGAHGELVRLRPEPAHLARFYLAIALGGWGGGVLVSLVAPAAFPGLWEYPLALAGLVLTFLAVRWRELLRGLTTEPAPLLLASLLIGSLVAAHIVVERGLVPTQELLFTLRNPYGIYRVQEVLDDDKRFMVRRLLHGSTVHGGQVQGGPAERRRPIAYYHPASPLADLLRQVPHPRRAAVIGLGSGACAAWFERGDRLVFYELDPDAERVARRCFSYLEDLETLAGREALRVVVGDARLRLEDDPLAPREGYDVIVVDAFSSDAIPTHLLTREALELYARRLAPGGWLLFHISSRYYDLRPVLLATARGAWCGAWRERMGLPPEPLEPLEYASEYYALRRVEDGVAPLLARRWRDPELIGLPEVAPWTDDHANLLAPFWLKIKQRSGW